jgi:hypothetical protein
MERMNHDDRRLEIARRLYDALCEEYPGKFITLCDAQGRILVRHAAVRMVRSGFAAELSNTVIADWQAALWA